MRLTCSSRYRQGCLLKGILFLHRISDVRATGTARKSLRMLQELCGDEALQNLVLVTTFWGNVPQDVGEARERQLVSEETLFKPLLDRGAKIRRHKDTERSAHEILQLLLDKGRQRFPLKIQKELVDERKDILETAAGIALDKELALQAQQHKAELERVKEEIAQALAQKDLESQRELEEIEREYKAKLKKAISDRQTISTDYAKKRAEQDDSEREFTYTPLQQTVEIPPVPLRGPQQPNVDKKVRHVAPFGDHCNKFIGFEHRSLIGSSLPFALSSLVYFLITLIDW